MGILELDGATGGDRGVQLGLPIVFKGDRWVWNRLPLFPQPSSKLVSLLLEILFLGDEDPPLRL